jgi:hypothetical protein
MVDAMLAIAEPAASRRMPACTGWCSGSSEHARRPFLERPPADPVHEYEDTRRWLERRLREALGDTDRADGRIDVFTGDRRGPSRAVKRAFNTNPKNEPLRILICTDAAREGINLQTYCSDLRAHPPALEPLAPGAAQRPH